MTRPAGARSPSPGTPATWRRPAGLPRRPRRAGGRARRPRTPRRARRRPRCGRRSPTPTRRCAGGPPTLAARHPDVDAARRARRPRPGRGRGGGVGLRRARARSATTCRRAGRAGRRRHADAAGARGGRRRPRRDRRRPRARRHPRGDRRQAGDPPPRRARLGAVRRARVTAAPASVAAPGWHVRRGPRTGRCARPPRTSVRRTPRDRAL